MRPPALNLPAGPSLGQVLVAVVVFAIFFLAARLSRGLIHRVTRRFPLQLRLITARVVFISLLMLGAFGFFAVILNNAGVAVSGVIAATVIASFGIQDILRNYVSGFYILLERNIKVGDVVEFEGLGRRAVVDEVRMRVSYLRGDKGELVVVPNAELFNKVVIVHPKGEVVAERPV